MKLLTSWILALLGNLPASSTWTHRSHHKLANSYLDAAQRPLWILEDELMKRQRADRQESDYVPKLPRRARRRQERQQASTAITIRVRPDSSEAEPHVVAPPPQPSLPLPLPHRLQLPSHYVQQLSQTPVGPNLAQRRRQPQSLPIFDSSPGDNALPTASYPIFVYNGTRGELLVNTMLSAQRYPMQEPVPGQVLYPPSTPMFRPKPIVERFRLPGQRALLNLTLIPFYAHEAITAPPPTATTTTTDATTIMFTSSATESETEAEMDVDPAIEPLAATTPMAPPYETQLPRSKRKRKPKQAKQYSAYRSPQEVVQWQPPLRSSPALEAPDNHRHYVVATTEMPQMEQLEEQEEEDELEPMEQLQAELDEFSQELQQEQTHLELETSTQSSESSPPSFQIVYVDESMEAPYDSLDSTTAAPAPQRQSSRYALKREYFAFPVYTLGKLLQRPARRPASHRARDLDIETGDSTWIILNSRYKGPYRSGLSRAPAEYFTSKYVQHPPR